MKKKPEDRSIKELEDRIIAFLKEAAPDYMLPQSILTEKLDVQWQDKNYVAAKKKLIDAGRVYTRRGRNGGIYLSEEEIPAEEAGESSEASQEERKKIAESGHYEAALEVFRTDWKGAYEFLEVCGQITAKAGRKKTGGRWTRPDITLLCLSKSIFDAHPYGDVRTIEIKLFDSVDVSSVFETLSHRSRAHFSYLLIVNTPVEKKPGQEERLGAVIDEAARHGIGLITASQTKFYSTWKIVVEARRNVEDEDSVSMEDFVSSQAKEAMKEFEEAFKRRSRAALKAEKSQK